MYRILLNKLIIQLTFTSAWFYSTQENVNNVQIPFKGSFTQKKPHSLKAESLASVSFKNSKTVWSTRSNHFINLYISTKKIKNQSHLKIFFCKIKFLNGEHKTKFSFAFFPLCRILRKTNLL